MSATAQILQNAIGATVRSSIGDELPIRVWTPARRPRRAVVACHGMVTHSGWFAQLGELLVERGIMLIAPDRRGNGAARHLDRVGDPDLLIDDTKQVVNAAREMSDDVTLFSWCGSSNFAVPAATTAAIDRFVLASPGLVPLAHMSERFRTSEPVDGFLPIHFDPAADFTDDANVRAMIGADELYLRWIPLALRPAWRQLGPMSREALTQVPVPTRCVLTRIDRMIDIPKTESLLGDIPIDWAEGGHGFLVEPAGALHVANILGA